MRERQREKEIVKRRLDALVVGQRRRARRARAQPGRASTASRASRAASTRWRRCSADQAYRLCFWGVAAEEINYRRFFDINDLAAIRDRGAATVLEPCTTRPSSCCATGKVTGLRIDHVDGLLDPRALPRATCSAPAPRPHGPTPTRRAGGDGRRTYVVVEKILTGDEELPREWPVHGTTGYEFLNVVNGLFVDAGGRARHRARCYQRAARRRAATSTTCSTARRS